MRRRSSVHLGPGAASLVLIFVMLSMSVLGMLSLLTSRNDLNLSSRSIQAAEAVSELNAAAERTRAAIIAVLRGGEISGAGLSKESVEALSALGKEIMIQGSEIAWTEKDAYRELDCAICWQTGDPGAPVGSWTRHRLYAAAGEMENALEGTDSWNW